MKLKILMLSLFSAIFLAACAETPDTVISKAEKKQNNHTAQSYDTKPQSISIDDLQEDIDHALSAEYANFDLSDDIDVEIPEAFVECDFVQVDGFSDRADEIAGRFFDSEILKSVRIEGYSDKYSDNYTNTSRGFREESKQVHYFVWDNGFICFMKPVLFEEQSDGGQCIKLYHVDRNDDISDKYILGDKEVSVAEAVNEANNWLKENYADLEPDYDIKVKTVIARQNDYGEYSLHFNIHKTYKGIELDELMQKYDDNRIKFANQRILMIMKNGTDIDYFSNLSGMIKPVEKQSLDNIISLTSALRSIETTFADFDEKPEINDINLKYTLKPQYDPESGIPFNAPNTEMSGRIVWEFVMDVPHDMISDAGSLGDVRRYIYVDAEDGQIDYEFDVHKLLQ